VLTGPNLEGVNSFDNPLNVAPAERKLDRVGSSFTYLVRPYSFTVLRLAPGFTSW
jgi:alpha-L-arabinofuranosidase